MDEYTSRINDIIDDCLEEYKSRIESGSINEIELKKDILNKVKISIQEDYKIDMLVNPKKKDIKVIEKAVTERISPLFSNDISDEEFEELDESVIKAFEKEIKKINNLKNNGNHKAATNRNGRLISKIKKEIAKAKKKEADSPEEKELLEKIENMLDGQLEWHKEELASRYKKEFLKKSATFAAVVTTLPKGIGLQAKRVINCINQLKEAKTNKERVFKVVELGKEIGLFVTTPVIFTVKFIVKHWYLILLLLTLLLSLLKVPFFNNNFKKEDQDDKSNNGQPEPELEVDGETIPDPIKEYILANKPVDANAPVAKPVITPGVNDPQPMTDTATGTPHVDIPKPIGKPVLTPGVNLQEPMTDTATGTPQIDIPKPFVGKPVWSPAINNPDTITEIAPEAPQIDIPKPIGKPVLTPGVNLHEPMTDTATGTPQVEVPATVAEPITTTAPSNDPAAIIETIEVTSEQQERINELVNNFIEKLENNYNFVIGSRHPDIIVVHNEEEFMDAINSINPSVRVDDPVFFYQKFVSQFTGRTADQQIVWPEQDANAHYFATDEEFLQYVQSGQESALSDYFNDYIAHDGKEYFARLGDVFSSEGIAELSSTLGISTELAIFMFAAYEALQYGLAIPTGGASLALPG